MKHKKWLIIVVVIGIVVVLWFSGVIPKVIANTAGRSYAKKHFSEMQLECISVKWADAYGDYLITFKDSNDEIYGCVIGPRYFPISIGQGLFAIESKYNGSAVSNVPTSYGEPIELAKAEFETVFAEYEGLKITETATLSRTDDATNIVVQIAYTSDHGDGMYGFEYIKDEYGNWDILQQGEDVTIDNLVKAD